MLLQVHALATLFMVGLIWFVQVVHYPMMADVGADTYAQYQHVHMQRTTWVVGPPMLAEAATAALLVFRRPPEVPAAWAWAGLALLALVWASTAFLQVPAHERLTAGFDPSVHESLVRTNWIRTVAWSLRGLLAVALVTSSARLLGS